MALNFLLRVNNRITAMRRVKVPGRNILLILPHCLQKDTCPQNIEGSLDECKRCGKCSIAALIKVRDEFGLVSYVVGGGRQAVKRVRDKDVKAVVAVACGKELTLGVMYAFPKPVIAVSNETPEGPCKNTIVDVERVAEAVRSLVSQ